MQTLQIETVIAEDGILKLKGLPFHIGEKVRVILKFQPSKKGKAGSYPLRGEPITYRAPFDSVAENEWDLA